MENGILINTLTDESIGIDSVTLGFLYASGLIMQVGQEWFSIIGREHDMWDAIELMSW